MNIRLSQKEVDSIFTFFAVIALGLLGVFGAWPLYQRSSQASKTTRELTDITEKIDANRVEINRLYSLHGLNKSKFAVYDLALPDTSDYGDLIVDIETVAVKNGFVLSKISGFDELKDGFKYEVSVSFDGVGDVRKLVADLEAMTRTVKILQIKGEHKNAQDYVSMNILVFGLGIEEKGPEDVKAEPVDPALDVVN